MPAMTRTFALATGATIGVAIRAIAQHKAKQKIRDDDDVALRQAVHSLQRANIACKNLDWSQEHLPACFTTEQTKLVRLQDAVDVDFARFSYIADISTIDPTQSSADIRVYTRTLDEHSTQMEALHKVVVAILDDLPTALHDLLTKRGEPLADRVIDRINELTRVYSPVKTEKLLVWWTQAEVYVDNIEGALKAGDVERAAQQLIELFTMSASAHDAMDDFVREQPEYNS